MTATIQDRHEEISSYSLPDLDDPRWESWAEPLRAHLHKSRTWPEIYDWGRQHRWNSWGLKQLIAWLSFHELAHWSDRRQTWRAV